MEKKETDIKNGLQANLLQKHTVISHYKVHLKAFKKIK